MLARRSRDRRGSVSPSSRSRRTALAPSGRGSPPVRSSHHSPEVEHRPQPLARVGELALVDHQAGVDLAGLDDVEDAVEGGDQRVVDPADGELQLQEGAGQPAGDRDPEARQRGRVEVAAGHDDRPVALAHRGPVGQQAVAIREVRVGVDGQRRDLEAALARPVVEGLDVAQHVLEAEAVGRDQLLGQRVEHEGVVGVGAVPEADQAVAAHAGRRCPRGGRGERRRTAAAAGPSRRRGSGATPRAGSGSRRPRSRPRARRPAPSHRSPRRGSRSPRCRRGSGAPSPRPPRSWPRRGSGSRRGRSSGRAASGWCCRRPW